LSQEKLVELADLYRNHVGGVERGERSVSLLNEASSGGKARRSRGKVERGPGKQSQKLAVRGILAIAAQR
jgi:hypothetical protein